jgi:hypothetical protein
MAFAFNPFTGNFDLKGSGGGGGASYIDGEVATFNDLPLDGSAPLDNAWLVREASGTWLIARKPAGIYIRTATGGTDRNADWTYAGILPDVFSDANFLLYDDADSTKNLKFQLSGITTGTTRTLTVPDKNITVADNADIPTASTATPSALGTAAAGTSNDFARADHVHAMPSASDVGAAASTHASTHFTGGTDALAPSDIGAQSLFASSSQVLGADITLSASRAQRVNLENYDGVTYNVTLPTTDVRVGDVFIFTTSTLVGSQTIRRLNFGSNFTTLATISSGQSYRIISTGTNSGSWQIDPVFTHTHAASAITSGTLDVARLPVGTTTNTVAAGNHTHVVADVTGAAASGSITTSGLTQATARILGRTTASTGAVEEISVGSGLSLSAGELTATGGGSGGTKTYAVFTPDNNQPTATAFATLDTRNSIAVLDFDDAATESVVFVGILPEAASLGSGLIVSLRWMATTATSGDVRWSVSWEKSNTDLDSDSFDTATAATATADGTSGIVTVTNITCTNIDSLAAGDLYRLRVQRVGGDGADTMTGDAELVAVEIRSAA